MKPGKAVLRYYGAAWWNQKAILWTLDIFWFLAFVFLVAISLDAVFFKGNNFRLVLGRASGHPLLLFLWTAGVREMILVREVSSRSWSSLWGAMLLVVLCLVIWQILVFFAYLSSSPLDVLKAGYRLLTVVTAKPNEVGLGWKDMGVSLLEIFAGLVLSGGAALIVSEGLSRSVKFRAWILPLLPLTYIAPIVLLPGLLGSLGITLYNWTAMCVAFLSFFPFVQVLWGLRDQPLLCRILLALDEALPFAFVAIVYGEAMNAVAGLEFVMVIAGATLQTAKGFATFLVTLIVLVGPIIHTEVSSQEALFLRWEAGSFSSRRSVDADATLRMGQNRTVYRLP